MSRDAPGFGKGEAKRSLGNNFALSLFQSPYSLKVREAVLETLFFKKMISNTLSPEEYGGYMVQDAAYIYDAITTFDIAAENEQLWPPDFALFYYGRSASFTSYASSYFAAKWKLGSGESVIMGEAAEKYVVYQRKLAQTTPKYLAIGILPCDMLWPWVAAQIDGEVSKTNVYRSWVDGNLRDGSSSTQKFVNKFFTESDRQASQEIFNEGILHELNFFRSACGEKPIDYSFG